ncbi:MAG: helix-turn-helix transcriptional regulator [Treponema sp.]|uniref:helix-turn-helix domain-containing protein n=1 Tax=Treponema sp. TaxID=166 RepID=UPI0025CC7C29|nr:helix-turn-helix transcriptional regulator [Treponema sp.]MBR0496642.1 helix-turn-helix transcriptional regulator [Treponema sp.]
MNAIRETFVNNLKFYRKKRGISQEKLSYAVGKSIAYINQIENKISWPQPEMVDKIAVALEIPSSALFEENGSPQNKKDLFENTFGKSLESELLSRIEKDVKEVCSLM